MKDDSGGQRRRVRIPRHLPRTALFVCLALVVLSLGMVLKPGNPPEPPQPPVSEQLRAAALADALRLRGAGEQLAALPGTPAAARPAVDRTVSLLTTQARALLRPGQAGASAAATAAPTAAASPSDAAGPVTPAGLAADLAGSGRQRLADAAAADGGMARLLAAAGTAQLLASSALAAAAGAPDPAAMPDAGPASPAASADAAPCPASAATPPDAPAAGTGTAGTGGTKTAGTPDLPHALAALISTEQETVYGYQVALTRLDGGAAKTAADHLARHEALIAAAETLSRSHCAPVPPREAGYALDPAFLASPGSGLAGLEAASLAAYGDLVAFSDGETRRWAISGLLGAARRAALWGAASGPLPGLAADPASFPSLPAG